MKKKLYRSRIDSILLLKIYFPKTFRSFPFYSSYFQNIDQESILIFFSKFILTLMSLYIKYFSFVPTFRKSGIFGIFIGEGIEESCEKKKCIDQGSILFFF